MNECTLTGVLISRYRGVVGGIYEDDEMPTSALLRQEPRSFVEALHESLREFGRLHSGSGHQRATKPMRGHLRGDLNEPVPMPVAVGVR